MCLQKIIFKLLSVLSQLCIVYLSSHFERINYYNIIVGNPVCARPPNKIGEYAELGAITRDIIKEQETAFLGECEGRKSVGGGKLKIVDVSKKESEVEVKELKSLSQVRIENN